MKPKSHTWGSVPNPVMLKGFMILFTYATMPVLAMSHLGFTRIAPYFAYLLSAYPMTSMMLFWALTRLEDSHKRDAMLAILNEPKFFQYFVTKAKTGSSIARIRDSEYFETLTKILALLGENSMYKVSSDILRKIWTRGRISGTISNHFYDTKFALARKWLLEKPETPSSSSRQTPPIAPPPTAKEDSTKPNPSMNPVAAQPPVIAKTNKIIAQSTPSISMPLQKPAVLDPLHFGQLLKVLADYGYELTPKTKNELVMQEMETREKSIQPSDADYDEKVDYGTDDEDERETPLASASTSTAAIQQTAEPLFSDAQYQKMMLLDPLDSGDKISAVSKEWVTDCLNDSHRRKVEVFVDSAVDELIAIGLVGSMEIASLQKDIANAMEKIMNKNDDFYCLAKNNPDCEEERLLATREIYDLHLKIFAHQKRIRKIIAEAAENRSNYMSFYEEHFELVNSTSKHLEFSMVDISKVVREEPMPAADEQPVNGLEVSLEDYIERSRLLSKPASGPPERRGRSCSRKSTASGDTGAPSRQPSANTDTDSFPLQSFYDIDGDIDPILAGFSPAETAKAQADPDYFRILFKNALLREAMKSGPHDAEVHRRTPPMTPNDSLLEKSNIRVPQPTKFKGEPTQVMQWLTHLKNYYTLYGVSDDSTRLILLVQFLDGIALHCITGGTTC